MKFLYIFPLFIIAFGVQSQNSNLLLNWSNSGENSLGGEYAEIFSSTATTAAAGFSYLASSVYNENTDVYDLEIRKLRNNGRLEWVTTINDTQPGSVLVGSLAPLSNNSIVFAGGIGDFIDSDVFIVSIASDGTVNWTERYHHPGSALNGGLGIAVSNNEIFVNGTTSSFGSNGLLVTDMLLLSYDFTGTQNWSTTHDDNGLNDSGGFISLQNGVNAGVLSEKQDGYWELMINKYINSNGALLASQVISDSIINSDQFDYSID